ncbi:macrophage metalloelastase-like [Contarinia nasturtii]|uniref:macrophage metalloelastase-like n=1 Tax=Contarinia nasturtii TaxID=265458 RepID=UPI0012D4BC1C|nr:macrophage metalloelastase-like [Contarinia nasturtii]XP_031619467.1 macrophage metalloelastase-like [Contarinia nasturtii]
MSFQLYSIASNSLNMLFGGFLLCLLIISTVCANPVPSNQSTKLDKIMRCDCKVKTMNYVIEFNNTDIFNNITVHENDVLSEGTIKLIQEKHGLTKTGELDPEFCALMNNRFQNKILNWRLINKSTKTESDMAALKNTLNAAFEKWSKVTKLKFRYVDSADAEIQVVFGSDEINCENGKKLTYSNDKQFGCAFLPGDIKNGGDVYFYEANWRPENDSSGRPLLPAAVYAFGYAIGLKNATFDKNGEISASEINEVQKIYNPHRAKPWTMLTN